MAHVKPQTPLHSDGDYIYPLTTADQILLADGSRVSERNFIFAVQEDIEIEIEKEEEKPQFTTLWTNPNPTNDFAGQTITLSQSIENFNFVRVYFIIDKSHQAVPTDIGSRDVYPGAWDCSLHGVCRTSINGMRSGRFNSPTQVTFEQGFFVGANPEAHNGLCIPYKIVGVN